MLALKMGKSIVGAETMKANAVREISMENIERKRLRRNMRLK